MKKSHGAKSGKYSWYSNTGILVLAKNTFTEVLCGKVHCQDAHSTCLFKDSVFLTSELNVSIPELEGRMFGCLFW
jgi:hypothetical protein